VVLVGVWLTMLVLQGLTGQTPGRRVMGVAVVRATSDGLPLDGRPGVLRCVARWCAHLLDAVLLLGYLRPLWHRERRTFADSIAGTVVVRRPRWPEPGADRDVAWRRTAAVTVGAFVLVAAGVATGATLGQTGGVEHLAHTECVLTPHVSRSLVHVDSVDLSVDRQWTSDVRLWSRPDDAAEERRVVSVQVAWQGPTTSVEPPRELLIRTTSPGGTVDNTVDLAAGSATLPVERAGSGTVDVEILLDGAPLTSCSATVPAVPGDAGGGQE
jgi:Mce-associated membrane protein